MVLEDVALVQNAPDTSNASQDEGDRGDGDSDESDDAVSPLEFLHLKRVRLIYVALEPKLQTMTDQFAMELLSDISDIVNDNCDAQSALKDRADTRVRFAPLTSGLR